MAVLWANARRFTNQVFGFIAVLVAAWLWTVVGAISEGELFWRDGTGDAVPWLRINGAISAFLAWAIWLLNESVARRPGEKEQTLRESLPWFCGCLLLASVWLFTELYVPSDSTPLNHRRGPGYVIFAFTAIGFHGWLLLRTMRQLRQQQGIRRVELQFLSLNLGAAYFLVILFTSFGAWLEIAWMRRSSCFVFLGAYVLAAWAITFHRVFDARQIFLSLGQRVVLVLLAAAGIAGTWRLFGEMVAGPVDFLLAVGVCASGALWLDQKSRRWLRLGNDHAVHDLRAAIIAIARTEPDTERLSAAYEQLLRRECRVDSATLVFEWEELRAGSHLQLSPDRPGFATLREAGWVTPESLERRRNDADAADLRALMTAHGLGLIVAVPRGSPAPTLLVALGAKDTRWPFTHPEIQCVQNVAELMDNILARSRLAAQAAMRAKMEHLAMMSRGLAHDLKNLITPISSYLVHTRGRGEPGSAEEEVHAAARRSVSIMTDYIREAAFFANQLTPHFQPARTLEICEAARELVAARAARRGVTVELVVDDQRLVADRVLLQRLLVNLLHNAIDAVAAGDRIWLRSAGGRTGWIRLQVQDEGCGIPAANLTRIFDPYFTTKEFGDDVRGFGLGLTICQKIAHLHRGTISVESAVDAGTTFTVDIPAAQTTRGRRETASPFEENSLTIARP